MRKSSHGNHTQLSPVREGGEKGVGIGGLGFGSPAPVGAGFKSRRDVRGLPTQASVFGIGAGAGAGAGTGGGGAGAAMTAAATHKPLFGDAAGFSLVPFSLSKNTTTSVPPLRIFVTGNTCTKWPDAMYADRVRYSTTPQASLSAPKQVTIGFGTPWCSIGMGKYAYLDTMRVQSWNKPLYFPTREAFLRGVYYFLYRLLQLQHRGQQLQNSTANPLNLFVVDGELTLVDETLDMDGPDTGNVPIAARVINALPELLAAESNPPDVLDTALLLQTHIGEGDGMDMTTIVEHVRGLLEPAVLSWPYVAKGNFGCVVDDDKDGSIVHKLLFANVTPEELVKETQMSTIIRRVDPGSEWSIVPEPGANIDDISKLPADTVAQCGVHELKKQRIDTQTLMRGGTTLQKTRPSVITSNWFIGAVGSLFTGMTIMQDSGLAHLDIKSDNIILHNDTYKYIDFGLCSNTADGLTSIRTILDNPSYNYPPEFYCWLYWVENGAGGTVASLSGILDVWYSRLPEFVRSSHGMSKPDYVALATKYLKEYLKVPDMMRSKTLLGAFHTMFACISIWQVGITIARAIHDALQIVSRTKVVDVPDGTKMALDYLQSLGSRMTHQDVSQRPSMTECMVRYREILDMVTPKP